MGKRHRHSSSSSSSSSSHSTTFDHSDPQILFSLILAALSKSNFNLQNPTPEQTLNINNTIQQSLHHLLLSLLSNSPNSTLHISPFLSFLPLLLTSKCSEIACCALEIVGAASLFSIEMNEQIALDDEIVKGLIRSVVSSRRSVSMAACSALLDLLTTSVGRHKFLELSAIENLILCFLQAPKSSTPTVSLVVEELDGKTFFRIGFTEEDEYIISLLHLLIILINDCTLEQLRKIPRELSKNLSTYLTYLWAQVHKYIPIDPVQESDRFFYLSNIRTNNLAESLFRLSMEDVSITPSFQKIKNSIFYDNFDSFIINHWEKSPVLIKNHANALFQDDAFGCFSRFVRSKETVSLFLACLLQNLSSAIPVSSDELDIISVLKEASANIGCPLIYQQDIRVVKTLDSKGELKFFHGCDVPYILKGNDISRCEEAYDDGYTFAMRGMELRFKDIAAVSEGVTCLFGQPSTGVNMYLTPPNSQGLARHRDDHCVLVCQIKGVKRWKVFPNPCTRLPRLYENVDLKGGNEDEIIDGYTEFLLREGDVLYIPRGFPHEARSVVESDGEPSGKGEFSLHLTVAIEIEPPFEWEGFVHAALHHWAHNCNLSSDHSSHDLDDAVVYLMHVAVKLIGDANPTCRKACLIGTTSFPSATEEFLQSHQRSTFNHLLGLVNSDGNFNDVFSRLEVAISKNEDPFESFKWLCHLDQNKPSMAMEDLLNLVILHKDKVEASFIKAKSKFCKEVVYDDVVSRYGHLLGKYRSMRKQYINGMLALSCI